MGFPELNRPLPNFRSPNLSISHLSQPSPFPNGVPLKHSSLSIALKIAHHRLPIAQPRSPQTLIIAHSDAQQR